MVQARRPQLPALDPNTVKAVTGSDYPRVFRGTTEAGERRRLGDALGLANFGVDLTRLPPRLCILSAALAYQAG